MTAERELLRKITSHSESRIPAHFIRQTQELLAQPEQDNIQYLLDQVARLTAENAMLKEKWQEPEQEPVAWKVIDGTHGGYMFSRIKPTEHTYKYNVVIPLYTTQPKREPLSDEEIADLWWNNYVGTADSVRNFARAIEKAHDIT
jgi:hypothetical protein